MEQSRSGVHGQKSGERHARFVIGGREGAERGKWRGYGKLKFESTGTMEKVWSFCALLR